ncbi:uncharacterized protein EHS24_004787 [Apiotrichum porosum]|uniref:Major facilitator superfamily (MFS) profile domain-containing protein n=1 Tax=Apiotrichum porosum TaxID=105984 RepID=A0A427Y629_9TREE|nr:uncharacterized protein EHS24_004787 [Apiotrichum porosum]RSH86522.1 hypothetical protein EHS24_004787 [Apiotrichum porosum]
MSAQPTESTPLLAAVDNSVTSKPTPGSRFPPMLRVYLVSVVGVMTFSLTQTALIYSFRTMTCDDYYETHEWDGVGDRCAIPVIESRTAKSIALMSSLTTGCTVINLFISSTFMSKYGVKAAMFQQTLWATLRNLTQIYAESKGGALGIKVITFTQVFNILGSGGGLQLCANSYVSMLSTDEERTANLGVTGGVVMLGAGIGFTIGGMLERFVGPLAPFQAAFGMLCFCTFFGAFFLPYRTPDSEKAKSDSDDDGKNKKTPHGFLGPLKFFVPRKVVVGTRVTRDWNLFFLGMGTFFSVLATGYVAMALQLVATNVFAFTPDTSGYMLSLTLFVRAFFLSVLFPRIISRGRAWLSGTSSTTTSPAPTVPSSPTLSPTPTLTEHPDDPDEAEISDAVGAPVYDTAPKLVDVQHGSTFDLLFLRYSILLDGFLTSLVTMATQGWHMYAAAAILPFASGTGPASKGVTLEFVPADERPAALSAIALVEKIAQVTTIGLFGYAFALLSEVGRPTWVFMLNASIAFIAFLLLLPVRMPRVRQPVAEAHA